MNTVDQRILDLAKTLGVEIVFDINQCKDINLHDRLCFDRAWAFYNTLTDKIYVNLQNFKGIEEFCINYAILHELTHWTGSPKRFKRFNYYNNFTEVEHDTEEKTADIGAKFLAEFLGVDCNKSIQSRKFEHWFANHELAETQGKQAAMYIVNSLYSRQNNSQTAAMVR